MTFPLDRLAQFREAAGYTQVGLASELGVHPRTVQRWELLESKPHPRDVKALFNLFPAAGTNGKRKAR
jgi:transcriptional regulator with XRE-family HTH domain